MKLIAKQPCSFGGKRFYIGDEIPVEMVQAPKTQEKYGILAIVNDEAQAAPAVDAGDPAGDIGVVVVKVGDTVIDLAPEDIQTILDVLTDNAEGAEKRIKQIDNIDILFIVNAADSRKTVQAAAKAQAQALADAQEGAESEGEQ